jgi:hypothetical protein
MHLDDPMGHDIHWHIQPLSSQLRHPHAVYRALEHLAHRQNPPHPISSRKHTASFNHHPNASFQPQSPEAATLPRGRKLPTNKHTEPTARHQHPIRQRAFRPSLTSLNTTLLVLVCCRGCVYFEDKCLYCGYICRYLCTAIACACARVPASCILLNIGESLSYSCGCDFWSHVVFRWVEGFGSTFTGFVLRVLGPTGKRLGTDAIRAGHRTVILDVCSLESVAMVGNPGIRDSKITR